MRLKIAVLYVGMVLAARAQKAVVAMGPTSAPVSAATPAGEVPVRFQKLERTPDLLVLLAADCLNAEDYDGIRKSIAGLWKAGPEATPVRFALFRPGLPLDIAGPFRSASELQTTLRKLKAPIDTMACLTGSEFFERLAEALAHEPSNWGITVAIGRIPSIEPSLLNYTSAWLIRQCLVGKRSLLLQDLSDQPSPMGDIVARATGAPAMADLLDPGPLTAIDWDRFPLSHGFDLQNVVLKGLPALTALPVIAAAPDAAIPSPAKFAELRAAVNAGDFAKALAANPSDREAVALALTSASGASAIPLLETSVELSPAETASWSKLGDLKFAAKDYAGAELALIRAKELGAESARASEQLGRIALESKDLAKALDRLSDSLRLDGKQQALWFFTADIAKQASRADRRIECLERGMALGGDVLTRRIETIHLYLDQSDKRNAARHVDLELPRLPADAAHQTTWAEFYEQLTRPDDALKCWRRVVAADAKLERAHYAISSILLTKKLYPDVLEATEQGLEADPKSARIELIRIDALENLGKIYDARRSLDAFAPDAVDVGILQKEAEFTDRFGGAAPAAWKRYAEALQAGDKAERERVYRRGIVVSAREGDEVLSSWFEDRLSQLLNPGSLAFAEKKTAQPQNAPAALWIPGGIDALSFIVGGQQGVAPERFLVDYCRRIVSRSQQGNAQEMVLLQKSVTGYFEQLRQLTLMAAMGQGRATLKLSVANKGAQVQTERVLNLLGWKLVHSKDKVLVQSGEKKSQARTQDLASALAIDQGGMQAAFEKGASFEIEIPFDSVPVLFDEATWLTPMHADRLAGGLAEALIREPDFARVYLGLASVDRGTAAVLMADFGFSPKYAELLASYSSALGIMQGHAAVPGGVQAEPLWTRLTGASPADPARFFRALFDKDQGRLLVWFFQLSELDETHQRFFTASQHRIEAFYDAFTQSEDSRGRAGRLSRSNSFSDFLRSIPIEEKSVSFPGSPQVWMVAGMRSTVTAQQTDKVMRKVRQVVAPNLEDEILLRLAKTRDKAENGAGSETAAFLAVARIDEHRTEPLDPQSALILGQNYVEFQSLYPYLSQFLSLTADDYQSFFGVLARLKRMEEGQAEAALGQFEGLLELLRLAGTGGAISDRRTTEILRRTCAAFVAAQDAAGFGAASLDTVRELLRGKPDIKDADNAVAEIILGGAKPVEMEWNGSGITLDASHGRAVGYGRVLTLQKIPELKLLLRMDETARRIAQGKDAAIPLAESLARDAQAMPEVEVPKTVKFQGRAKQSIQRASPMKLRQVAMEIQQAAQKKKVNPKDLEKLARDLLQEMAPQVRLALAGIVYAAYLDPADILVENDPLLVRKHQAFELSQTSGAKPRFPPSELEEANAGEGSFFSGSFAQFALVSARGHGEGRTPSSYLQRNQSASIRLTPWASWGDTDQRMLGLKLRMAREWCVYAGQDPALFAALSEDTLGLLSLTRRRELLDSITAHRWSLIGNSLTDSDLLALADRYLARYSKTPWLSPVDADLRRAEAESGGDRLDLLGSIPASLYGCGHPHLVSLAPYEEYEHHLFPVEMAERAAEMKLYLAAAMDRAAVPAAAMSSIANEVSKRAFASMKMSDERDWVSALKAFAAIDEKFIGRALEAVSK